VTIFVALTLIVGVQAAAALLVVSAYRHRRDRPGLAHLLVRHRVLPRWAVPPVSCALPAGSLLVGAAALAAPSVAAVAAPALWSATQRVAAALVAALYVAFLGYLAVLRRRAPGQPCGCLGSDERTEVALLRAAVAGTVATLAAIPGPLAPLTAVPGWPPLYLMATAVGGLAAVVTVVVSPRSARPSLSGG